MITLAILVGFAVMVLLPCAIAFLGSRPEAHERDAYADRAVEDPARPVEALAGSPDAQPLADALPGSLPVESKAEPALPAMAQAETPKVVAAKVAAAVPVTPQAKHWGDTGDPPALQRAGRPQNRVERTRLEALVARAFAARANAEALAALARASQAEAEAAAAEATALEREAAQAIQNVQRAA